MNAQRADRLDLVFLPAADASCTKMQRNEHNPALNPALIFGIRESRSTAAETHRR
jgi:hypothetical protein